MNFHRIGFSLPRLVRSLFPEGGMAAAPTTSIGSRTTASMLTEIECGPAAEVVMAVRYTSEA